MRGEKGISLWGGSTAVAFMLVCGCCAILFSDMLIPETLARIGIVVGLVWLIISVSMWIRAHFSEAEKSKEVPPARDRLLAPPRQTATEYYHAEVAKGVRAAEAYSVIPVDREWAYWSRKDEMAVWQAAYLWNGLVPAKKYPSDETPPEVRLCLDKMIRGLENEMLTPVRFQGKADAVLVMSLWFVGRSAYATVNREALKAYAAHIGETPEFLQT